METRPALAYDGLSDEQLENLVFQWMEQKLQITPEATPSVLALLGGRDGARSGSFHRGRTIELVERPEELRRGYDLLENATASWLGTYLPAMLVTASGVVTVNRLQVLHSTGLTEEELPHFLTYLREAGILLHSRPHRWGEPFEAWHFDPLFIEEYRVGWQQAGFFAGAGPQPSQLLAGRLEALTQATASLNARLARGGAGSSSRPTLTSYCSLAQELGLEVGLLMDAELLLFAAMEQEQPLRLEFSQSA